MKATTHTSFDMSTHSLSAIVLLGFVPYIEVIKPIELKEIVKEWAKEILDFCNKSEV